MQHPLIKQLTTKPMRWLLQKNISYWHKTAFRFSHSSNGYTLKPAESCGSVVVLARNHYQEFIHLYPVAQLGELKQILRTEYPQAGVLHYIGPEQDQRRLVCTIVIPPETLQQFSRLTLLIPESLLLWHSVKADSAIYQCDSLARYFLYSAAAVPVSQQIGAFCPDVTSFALNNGIPDQAAQKHVDADSYANKLVQALANSVFVIAKLAVLVRPQVKQIQLPFKAIAITAAVSLLLYIVLVTAYYSVLIDNRKNQLAELGSSVNQLLDIQQQLQHTGSDSQRLISLRQDKQYFAHLWLVIVTLLQQDTSVQLQNITTENGRLVIRGQAGQATSVLTSLQRSEWVLDARFDAPVRRQTTKDAFVISL
ncbi:MAG: hypothetical protein ACI8U1_002958, partial [Rheinheimera aquimaris]